MCLAPEPAFRHILGCPGVTLRRLSNKLGWGGEGHSGGTHPLRPGRSEVDLFRDGKGVIDLNAEIPDGALNLGMVEQ